MAKHKDDPSKATHFMTNHVVGPFARGTTVTTEELHKSFGRDRDATPEEHEAYRSASLQRLLDLGAVTPTDAPEEGEGDDVTRDEKSAERMIAEDEAAIRKAKAEETQSAGGKSPTPAPAPAAPKK